MAERKASKAGSAQKKETQAEDTRVKEDTSTMEGMAGQASRAASDTAEASSSMSRSVVTGVRDVLHETIGATEQVGTDVGRVVRNTALGVVGGVGAVGGATVDTARDLLVGVVGGVRDVLGAALPRTGRHTAETTQHEQRP